MRIRANNCHLTVQSYRLGQGGTDEMATSYIYQFSATHCASVNNSSSLKFNFRNFIREL